MLCFNIVKGKGASLGVGRGRAVAMRAKVFLPSLFVPSLSILFLPLKIACSMSRYT